MGSRPTKDASECIQHLHPLLLANIDRVKDKQAAPLSLTDFEQIYCEPAETTQPQAHSTSAQPPGSYHAVAPPSTTPEAIVHFHSYNITTEDYPALEDLTNADAPDPASHPQPPTADTSSADSGQQPAQNPPAAEPRTLAPHLYHKVQDHGQTLLVYVTEEPPYAMYAGVRLLPQDEPIALGYNNPGYARADYTNIEDAPTFVITSSLDSGSNNSESDEQSVHAGNDDMDLEEQAAPTAPWFVEHLPRWSPKIPTNYHEAG
eukprot:gene25810-31579_t